MVKYDPYIVGFLLALCVLCLMQAIRYRRSDRKIVSERLSAFQEPIPKTIAEMELNEPFTERFLRPFFERLGKRLAALQPQGGALKRQALLELAGKPLSMNAESFMALQLFSLVIGVLVGIGLAWLLHISPILGILFGAVLGYMAPRYQIKRMAQKRQKEVLKALPSALDLLCISVEAGLGFDAALQKVVEKFDNALSQEFSLVLSEIRLGKPRDEALEALSKKLGVVELRSFIQALVQSDQLGVGIAKVLRIQSEEIRRKRRQQAETKAQQASLKMLFPMVLLIFPALFIVLLGPAAIHLLFNVN